MLEVFEIIKNMTILKYLTTSKALDINFSSKVLQNMAP